MITRTGTIVEKHVFMDSLDRMNYHLIYRGSEGINDIECSGDNYYHKDCLVGNGFICKINDSWLQSPDPQFEFLKEKQP